MSIDFSRVDFDMQWLEVRGGKLVNGYAFLPFVCEYLSISSNDCTIYERRPQWCRKFPVEQAAWLKAMGCKFWED
jgi:Fe-S-cluster containining protein